MREGLTRSRIDIVRFVVDKSVSEGTVDTAYCG